MMMHEGFAGLHLIWMIVMVILAVVPFWKICFKVGYPGWFSFLIIIPLINLLFLYFLAFSEWPSRRGTEMKNQ
jgi:hypothetical protein